METVLETTESGPVVQHWRLWKVEGHGLLLYIFIGELRKSHVTMRVFFGEMSPLKRGSNQISGRGASIKHIYQLETTVLLLSRLTHVKVGEKAVKKKKENKR